MAQVLAGEGPLSSSRGASSSTVSLGTLSSVRFSVKSSATSSYGLWSSFKAQSVPGRRSRHPPSPRRRSPEPVFPKADQRTVVREVEPSWRGAICREKRAGDLRERLERSPSPRRADERMPRAMEELRSSQPDLRHGATSPRRTHQAFEDSLRPGASRSVSPADRRRRDRSPGPALREGSPELSHMRWDRVSADWTTALRTPSPSPEPRAGRPGPRASSPPRLSPKTFSRTALGGPPGVSSSRSNGALPNG